MGAGDVIDEGKKNVCGVGIDWVDYEAAVRRIIDAAHAQRPYMVTALAVHGVMTGVDDPEHRYRLNQFDLVTPDGQPVRWAINLLYKGRLKDRVYGPRLTLKVLDSAAEHGLPVYFYGSKREVVDALAARMKARDPRLVVAGAEPSKFRQTSPQEKAEIVERIRMSGARIVFVGLGCPRQEVFVYEYANALAMPALAVGAAFDYHAGLLEEPPDWVQRSGLQGIFRMFQEPRRLWRRYLILTPRYLSRIVGQGTRLWKPRLDDAPAPKAEVRYG